MTDHMHYYLGRDRIRELIREAQNEREAQAIIRSNKRQNQNGWVRRVMGGNNNRTETGEKN